MTGGGRRTAGTRGVLRWFVTGARRSLHLHPWAFAATVHAFLAMCIVEVLVRRVRLERLAHLVGARLDLGPAFHRPGPQGVRLGKKGLRQYNAARRVAASWPFSDGPCLRESLVAAHLLRRFKPSLRVGVGEGDGGHYAHAWLEINGRPLEDVRDFKPFQTANLQETG